MVDGLIKQVFSFFLAYCYVREGGVGPWQSPYILYQRLRSQKLILDFGADLPIYIFESILVSWPDSYIFSKSAEILRATRASPV